MNAALAAATGNDPALIAELHAAFAESACRQADLLKRSRCDGNWRVAALRLKGLAASFHADELSAAAEAALEAAPGDPVAIRTIETTIERLSRHDAQAV